MRNIVRAIVYIGLVGMGGLYRYQHPTRYADLFSRGTSNPITVTGSQISGTIIQQGTATQKSGESIVTQLAAQLSGTTDDGKNPFGETYITITDHSAEIQTPIDTISNPQDMSEGKGNSQPYLGEIADTSTCITPRGRSVAGADWTLAFESDHANTDNVCIIEKRICTQGVLGGSYTNHTCYFNGQGGEYEYLGIRGSDSTTLINQAEQQLGIISSNSSAGSQHNPEQYRDDTQGVSNYALIDASSTPRGRSSNGGYEDKTRNSKLETREPSYDLGPIVARTPETKISASKEKQINPNGNGVQGVINNRGNSPRLSYSTDNAKLESTGGPAPTRISCTTPWGTEVFHNQHVIAFQSSSVPQGQSCKSEFRTCTQGYLRGSYTQQTCTIEGVSNTNTNNPYTNGRGYYTAGRYYNDDYDYHYYDDNGRYNDNRYNDRYYQTYNYSYRAPYKPYNNCIVDGYGFVGHGSTFTMYDKSEVGPGQVCRSIVRMCDDGVLNGSADYKYTSCTQSSKTQATTTIKTSSSKTVTTKATTTSKPVAKTTATANTYQYNRGCQDLRFGYINHGSSVKAFKNDRVAYPKTCEYEYRTCSNGTLLGSYVNETCSVRLNNGSLDVYRYNDTYDTNGNRISRNNYRYNDGSVNVYRNSDYYDGYYVYDDRYYNNRYYNNRYNTEQYDTPITRYTQYDSNIRSYGAKSDPQAGSCNVSNYGILNNSDFLVMYRETNPAPGVACDSVVRTCSNGSLSGPSNYNGLRCSTTASVCGNGAKESGEQCDPKNTAKSGRGSGGCSLACTPVQQITVIEEKCYDYTDTAKLCAGKNGGTVQDTCKQVRSCPVIDTKPGIITFIAWEEQNGNRSKDACELSISDVTFNLVQCGGDISLRLNQTTYNGIIDNVTPGSYQIVARPISQYGKSGYYPQSSNPRPGDPANTFRSSCFTVNPGSSTVVQGGFKAPMPINDKTHPRWIFDPVNGQKTGYPGC